MEGMMIKLFYRLFNHHKIDEMQLTLDIYRERNSQLEKENMEYKGYKLKYEVTKLYVEDDEALLELFDIAKKHNDEIVNRERMSNMTVIHGQSNCDLQGLQGQSNYGLGLGSLGGIFK